MKIAALLVATLTAHAATRNVLLKWTPSTSAGVVAITYNVFRCQVIAPAVGCQPTTPINTAPLTASQFTDPAAVVGDTYQYGVEAVGPACATGADPCGASTLLELPAPLSIHARPAQPSATADVTLTITTKGIAAIVD